MTIKEIIKGKITNMNDNNFDFNEMDDDAEIDENIFTSKDYAFYCYEGQEEVIPEMDLVVITGHETTIVYNTKTKKYKEIETR